MRRGLLFILLSTIFAQNLICQETGQSEHESNHHEHYRNEIGIANSAVYLLKESVFSYGLHVHYLRTIPQSKFGLGLGYERIFGTHKHNSVGLVMAWWPTEMLNLNISPGVAFEDGNPGASFALHLEASYGFEIRFIHLGPLIEFAYDPEDYHLSIGLHIGYDF